ncbi:MAG: hypothetical protein ABI863_11155 [Ginsengibacter sp.]
MSATLKIHDILSKIKKLDKEEQFTLLERIVALIRKNESPGTPTRLSQISGIGSKVWKHTNIDEYIDQERQW